MRLIEFYLGISPDGGNGITETSYVIAFALAFVGAIFRQTIGRGVKRCILLFKCKRV
jgi:hypothetical protein